MQYFLENNNASTILISWTLTNAHSKLVTYNDIYNIQVQQYIY